MGQLVAENTSLSLFAKYALTFGVYFCFFAYGLGYSIVSPVLLTLCDQLNVTFQAVSHGVLLRSFSFCIGSLIGSGVFMCIDRRFGLVLFIVLDGLATLAISLSRSYWVYLVSMSSLGMSAGAIDVATTVTILHIWKEKSNPFMQGLHFAFSIGMVVSPILAAPFLADRTVNTPITSNATSSPFDLIELATGSDMILVTPFAICTCILMVSASIEIILAIKYPHSSKPHSLVDEKSSPDSLLQSSTSSSEKSLYTTKNNISLIIAGCLLLSFYVVCEMNSFVFAPNFIVYVGFSEEKSAHLAFLMASAFAICRLFSIIIATRVSTLSMLYIHLTIIGLGNFVLLVSPRDSLLTLSIGLCILGAGLSAVFPALYAFYEELMTVTNGICGIFMFASALSVSVTPIFEGKFLPTHPPVFVYINLVALTLCFIILTYIHLCHRRTIHH